MQSLKTQPKLENSDIDFITCLRMEQYKLFILQIIYGLHKDERNRHVAILKNHFVDCNFTLKYISQLNVQRQFEVIQRLIQSKGELLWFFKQHNNTDSTNSASFGVGPTVVQPMAVFGKHV